MSKENTRIATCSQLIDTRIALLTTSVLQTQEKAKIFSEMPGQV